MNESVSIIIPAYNAEKTLARAIDSVLAQTYSAVEILVVNDGSTDGTRQVCEAYRGKIRYIEQENKGVSAARNLGIREAKGEYIAFLDADDEYTDSFFSTFRDALIQYPDSKAFCGAYVKQCGNQQHRCVQDDFSGGAVFQLVDIIGQFAHDNYLVHPDTAILHRDVFNEVGYFLEGMHFGEDIELWTRIAGKFPWCFMNQVVAIYHEVASSATNTTPLCQHGIDFIYDEAHMRQIISADLWPSYREFRRNFCANRASCCFKNRKYELARRMVWKIFPARMSLRYGLVLLLSMMPSALLNCLFEKRAEACVEK
jgi:glycosyltransferase involved in cell wall biosynthesis